MQFEFWLGKLKSFFLFIGRKNRWKKTVYPKSKIKHYYEIYSYKKWNKNHHILFESFSLNTQIIQLVLFPHKIWLDIFLENFISFEVVKSKSRNLSYNSQSLWYNSVKNRLGWLFQRYLEGKGVSHPDTFTHPMYRRYFGLTPTNLRLSNSRLLGDYIDWCINVYLEEELPWHSVKSKRVLTFIKLTYILFFRSTSVV